MQNKIIIFSAPSGSGKTTIAKVLLEKIQNLEFSISACSRPQRPNEVDGEDYYFLSIEDFNRKIKNNEFLEYEEVYANNFYGTLQSEVERIWNKGMHVMFDVDAIGGMNIKKIYGERALSIFIKTPSFEDLHKRLKARSTETEESLKVRKEKAKTELGYAKEFDKVIVNDVLEVAIDEVYKTVLEFLENK